jgi:hypothetical protein
MANTLNIPERTLAEIADSTNQINMVGLAVGWRQSVYEPIVCRISDHADNDAAEVTDDTDKMAIFSSKCHGAPWTKDKNTLEHIIHQGGGTPPANATIIYPNHDYQWFE